MMDSASVLQDGVELIVSHHVRVFYIIVTPVHTSIVRASERPRTDALEDVYCFHDSTIAVRLRLLPLHQQRCPCGAIRETDSAAETGHFHCIGAGESNGETQHSLHAGSLYVASS